MDTAVDTRKFGQQVKDIQVEPEMRMLAEKVESLLNKAEITEVSASVIWGQREASESWEQGIGLSGSFHKDRLATFNEVLGTLSDEERGKLIFITAEPTPSSFFDHTVSIYTHA